MFNFLLFESKQSKKNRAKQYPESTDLQRVNFPRRFDLLKSFSLKMTMSTLSYNVDSNGIVSCGKFIKLLNNSIKMDFRAVVVHSEHKLFY